MKLITLNIWGGHIHDPLLNFFSSHQEIDIFCLQEVYKNAELKVSTDDKQIDLNIFTQIEKKLPHHIGFFRPIVNSSYGVAIFIRKDLQVLNENAIIVYDNPNYSGSGPSHSRNLQWLQYKFNNRIYTILNLHGLWNGNGKNDSLDRIIQSQKIKGFMDTLHNTPKILCGDFNLRPDTQSLEIIAKGMNNLIELNKVTSTRTSFYPKAERFADYIFTSPEIDIIKFAVLPDEVSDHAPLYLEFN